MQTFKQFFYEGLPGGGNTQQAPAQKSSGEYTPLNLGLDIAGLVPGLGEPADVLNTVLLAKQGNYLGAAFSAISVIPVLGDALGKGGKLAIWAQKALRRSGGGARTLAGKAARKVVGGAQAIKKTKAASGILKATPKVNKLSKQVKGIRMKLTASRHIIDDYMDTLEGRDPKTGQYTNKLGQYVPGMRKALDDFMQETPEDQNMSRAAQPQLQA
jgi:hypothetical protein